MRGGPTAKRCCHQAYMPCADCKVDTSMTCGNGHHYIARQLVWRQAIGQKRVRFLCLDCLERRIGRPLVAAPDLLATPPEVLASFAGKKVEPLQADKRQQELEAWRAYVRSDAWIDGQEARARTLLGKRVTRKMLRGSVNRLSGAGHHPAQHADERKTDQHRP
jgi:hypothetical protein